MAGRGAPPEGLTHVRWTPLARASAVFVGYSAMAWAFGSHVPHGGGGAFWPPLGILVAALLLSPVGEWASIFGAAALAGLLFELAHGCPPSLCIGLLVSDAAEAVIAAGLIRRMSGRRAMLTTPPDVMRFWLYGAVVAPLIGATVDGLCYVGAGSPMTWVEWATRWSSESLGIVMTAPAILAVAAVVRGDAPRWGRRDAARVAAMTAISAGTGFVIFSAGGGGSIPFKWVVMLTLLLTTWGLDPLGVAVCGAATAGVSLHLGTLPGGRLAAPLDVAQQVLLLQMFFSGALFASALMNAAVSRLKAAEAEARRERDAVRDLTRRLDQVEDRERRRVATLVHDQISTTLAVAKMKLGAVNADLGGQDARDAATLVSEALDESRRISSSLAPPILEELGLLAAIEWLGTTLLEPRGIDVSVPCETECRHPGEEIERTLFVCASELLENVADHSSARKVLVKLDCDDSSVTLIVSDDGIGFRPEDTPEGLGLPRIRERLAWLDGSLDLATGPGRGVRATVVVPRPEGPAAVPEE